MTCMRIPSDPLSRVRWDYYFSMSKDDPLFARSMHTGSARIDPTIWRESDVTMLVERARTGSHADRHALLAACVERFQFMVRRIVQEDGLSRMAPSVTEVVHEVFYGEMQAVLDASSIGKLQRRDFERLFAHKVRQHLLKLVERCRRESSGQEGWEEGRERPGSDRTPRPDVMVERLETELKLFEALDAFPDQEARDLLVQRYFMGRTVAELAEITGEPLSTVYSRIRAAEDRLGRSCVAGLAHERRRREGAQERDR